MLESMFTGDSIPPRWTVNDEDPIFGDGPLNDAEQLLVKVIFQLQ